MLRCVTLVTTLLLLSATVGLAQAQSTGIAVTVYIVDSKGNESLADNAEVTLARRGRGAPVAVRRTDAAGRAKFTDLEPGMRYAIIVSVSGYGPVRDRVSAVAGQMIAVVLAVQPAIVHRSRVTSESDIVQLEGATTETAISGDFFADLPVLGREYQNVLDLAPGVNDDDDDGNPNVHGARERDFQLAVDGVSNVDPLSGEFQSYINPDSIEELLIVDSGADASYGGAVGGYGKITTKSGSNQFEGAASFFLRDSALDNDGGGNQDPLRHGLIQPSFILAGPVLKDHVWFMTAHEYVDASYPISILGGRTVVQSETAFRHADKLSWQVTPRNKLQLQYTADPLEIAPYGISSTSPPESSMDYEQGGPTYALKWTAPFSPNFFWEATLAFSDIERRHRPYDPDARNTCINDNRYPQLNELMCIDADRGGLRSGPFFQIYKDNRQRWTYRIDAEQFIPELVGGDHRIKFGTDFQRVHFERFDQRADMMTLSRYFGRASFTINEMPETSPSASLTTVIPHPLVSETEARGNYFAAYISDSYTPAPNLNIVVGLRISREEISSNGYSWFDPRAERQAWAEYLDECTATGFSARQCFAGLAGHQFFTVHADDVPRRYYGCNVSSVNPEGVTEINNRWQCDALEPSINLITGEQIHPINTRQIETFDIVNNNIAPRFSISWDPWNDGKTKVSGSWGRYFGNTILAPITDEAGPSTTNRIQELDETGRIITRRNTVQSAYTISMIDRNLKRQYMDEWAIAFEREISTETAARVRYLHRDYMDQLQNVDINHSPVTWEQAVNDFPRVLQFCRRIGDFADCSGRRLINEYGRIVDVPDGRIDLQVASPFFNNVYEVGNHNQSSYRAFILDFTRRFYRNWEMTASYTYSRAVGNAEDYGLQLGDDVTNTDDEYGYMDYDVRHLVKFSGRVYVPLWSRVRIGGSASWHSGYPYSLVEAYPVFDFPTNLGRGASGIDHNDGGRLTFQAATPRVTYITGRRNDQRNAPIWDFNLNVQKDFIYKDMRITTQFDIFNVLNDTSLIIQEIRRLVSLNDTGTVAGYEIVPVAYRRRGRHFQLSVKVNF